VRRWFRGLDERNAGTGSECAGVSAHKSLNTGLRLKYFWMHHFGFSCLVDTCQRKVTFDSAKFSFGNCAQSVHHCAF
jgi:hypothetical protein